MENNIASILFARGIMPDDFISYSTYAAVGEIVKEMERLREERKELVEALREAKICIEQNTAHDWVTPDYVVLMKRIESLLSKFEVPNE